MLHLSRMNSRSVARNFSIQAIGRVLAVAIGLVSIGILTRSLGADGFGAYTTAITFLQLFGVVVDFGLTLTLIVMISEKGADEERLVGNIFALRMISGAIVFALAPISILAFPWSSDIKQAVAVGALAYVLMGGATLLVGIFQKHQSMWRAAIAEVINRAVLLLLISIFAYANLGIVAMVGASIIANLAWLIAMIKLAKPFLGVKFLVEWSVWKKVWSRSWPIAISIFFNLLYLKGDILFLAYFRDQTEVGYYGVAYRVIDVLTALPVMAMGLLLPSLVKQWTEGKKVEFRAQVTKIFDVFMIAVIPIIIGAQAVSAKLTLLIAGAGYEISGQVLQVLIIAVLGVFLGALYGHLIVALNKQKVMTWGYIAVAIVAVIGYLWLIPEYGMWGAVWVTLVSEALIALITFIVVYKVSGSLPSLKTAGKAVIASGVMYLFLRIIPSAHVLISISLGAVIYILAMLSMNGISRESLASIVGSRK